MAGKIRMIQSPGVEINEIDKSQVAPSISGSYVFIPGYADKGEDYDVVVGSSIDQFTDIYGTPTNEAEKYFYYAAKEVMMEGGTAVTMKLPYNNIICNHYKGLALKFRSDEASFFSSDGTSNEVFDDNGSFAVKSMYLATTETDMNQVTKSSNLFNKDTKISGVAWLSGSNVQLTNEEYDILSSYDGLIDLVDGTASAEFPNLASQGAWDLMVVNRSKETVSFMNEKSVDNKACEGLFYAIVDYASASYVQRLTKADPSGAIDPDYDKMNLIESIFFPYKTGIELSSINKIEITDRVLTIKMADSYVYNSFSEDLMRLFPTITVEEVGRTSSQSGAGVGTFKQVASTEYAKHIVLAVCKLTRDTNSSEPKVTPQIVESFFGSLDMFSKNPSTGQSDYICNIVNAGSSYIKLFDNKTFFAQYDTPQPQRVTSIMANKYLGDGERVVLPYYAGNAGIEVGIENQLELNDPPKVMLPTQYQTNATSGGRLPAVFFESLSEYTNAQGVHMGTNRKFIMESYGYLLDQEVGVGDYVMVKDNPIDIVGGSPYTLDGSITDVILNNDLIEIPVLSASSNLLPIEIYSILEANGVTDIDPATGINFSEVSEMVSALTSLEMTFAEDGYILNQLGSIGQVFKFKTDAEIPPSSGQIVWGDVFTIPTNRTFANNFSIPLLGHKVYRIANNSNISVPNGVGGNVTFTPGQLLYTKNNVGTSVNAYSDLSFKLNNVKFTDIYEVLKANDGSNLIDVNGQPVRVSIWPWRECLADGINLVVGQDYKIMKGGYIQNTEVKAGTILNIVKSLQGAPTVISDLSEYMKISEVDADATCNCLVGFDPNYDVDKIIEVGSLLRGLDKAMYKISNIDEIQIDIALDAGISTIAEFVNEPNYT